MNIYSISIRSLLRRKSKTFLLIFGLVLAVSSVVTLGILSSEISENISRDLDEFGANILITPKTDELALSYGSLSLGDVTYSHNVLLEDDIRKISNIKNYKNISVISPKLLTVERFDSNLAMIVGVNFDSELRLKKWWNINGSAPATHYDALIGYEVHNKLGLNISDTFWIKDQQFKVSGIIQTTGSQDDALIFINIKVAQNLFNKIGELSLIELSALCYDCPIEEIVSQTSEQLPNAKVSAIRQSIDSKMAAVNQFENFSMGISGVILIISLLIVFTNVNSSVTERIREIGVFKAIGFCRSYIFRIIFTEVFISSSIAGLVGYLIGVIAANFLFPIFSYGINAAIRFNPLVLLMALVISITVGVGAAIYPAYRATQLDPTVTFRTL